MAIVYSYFRFSDPRQSKGSSAARQLQYAEQWAEQNGHTLDKNLSLNDEGLSAYHQRHVKSGALGTFLQAIETGSVLSGSILIVEQLDRLSRAEPLLAQAQMSQIINAGITIVTAGDGKSYSRESLKENPMDLVYSLLLMIRAHEESDTKSKRVKAAIQRQCEQWVAGTYRGIIRNGKDPAWLKWDGEKFEFVPERAAQVKAIIESFMQGFGTLRTLKKLTTSGDISAENNASISHMYKLIQNPCLIGHKRISVNGTDYLLQDYYPAILTKEEFEKLQVEQHARKTKKKAIRSEVVPVLTGQKLLYCGYCGASMSGQNYMARIKKRESVSHHKSRYTGYRRLICSNAKSINGQPCLGTHSIAAEPVEKALISYCSDQMHLDELSKGDSVTEDLHINLKKMVAEREDLQSKQDRLTDLAIASDGDTPAIFVKKAREIEQRLEEVKSQIRNLQIAINAKTSSTNFTTAKQWSDLLDSVINLDSDARLATRKMVEETFSKIVVYTRGILFDASSLNVDIVIVSKTGVTKMLKINRKTGKLVRGEIIDTVK